MSERGPLAIVEGRHPLMEQLQGSDDFVPNDTYLAGRSLPVYHSPHPRLGQIHYNVSLQISMAGISAIVLAHVLSSTKDRCLCLKATTSMPE